MTPHRVFHYLVINYDPTVWMVNLINLPACLPSSRACIVYFFVQEVPLPAVSVSFTIDFLPCFLLLFLLARRERVVGVVAGGVR